MQRLLMLRTSALSPGLYWRFAPAASYHHSTILGQLTKKSHSLSHNNNNNNNNINNHNVNVTLYRSFTIRPALFELNKDSSKVEQTVKALRQEAEERKEKASAQAVPQIGAGEIVLQQRSLGKRIWDEMVHYYHGFRLLFIDIGIASRLLWKLLNGSSLSRSEYKQLVRTSSDVFRLVPFSVFIIIPFMELLLPVFLKFFPGMLPSTFTTASEEESKVKKQLKLKLEMAKFLQTTLDEMTLQYRGESHSARAKEFAQFFENIRKSGEQASNEDILRFSKLFEDEITLDSLTRPQLVALCRLLELKPIGTSNFLSFQLRMKLRSLKADDQMIWKEGIETLTVPELQSACRARGMRAIGISEDRLRSQLSQWLELSLHEKIPPSLLLLSRVLYLPENIAHADQLKATIQALPKEVGTETRYKIGETEGKIDNRTKIELVKQKEEAIKRENEEEKRRIAQAVVASEEEMLKAGPVLMDRATDLSKEEHKEESVLSREDIDSIEDAIDNIATQRRTLILEKEELDDIKEELRDYKEDLTEFKEIAQQTGDTKRFKESKAAKRLRNRVDKMVNKMDNLLSNLESKKEVLESKITQLEKEGKDIDKEKKDVLSINELLNSMLQFKKFDDDTKLSRIIEVLDTMDLDHDGQIELDHVVKVIELIGKENVEVTPKQVKEIINLLIQEEKLTEEDKKKKIMAAAASESLPLPPIPPTAESKGREMKADK